MQPLLECASFAVDETKHGKVYLLTGEGCVVAMWIGRRRGSVDEGLRRRRRRPLLVGRRGVRVMRCVVRRVMAKAACTTQQKTTVARRRRHIVMMVLVNGSKNEAVRNLLREISRRRREALEALGNGVPLSGQGFKSTTNDVALWHAKMYRDILHVASAVA